MKRINTTIKTIGRRRDKIKTRLAAQWRDMRQWPRQKKFKTLAFALAIGAGLFAVPQIVLAAVSVGKTGVNTTTNSTVQAVPGNELRWVMSYGHSGQLGTMQLNDAIPAGSTYVPNSFVTPPGYSQSFSVNGGTSYGATDPGTAATNLRADGPAPATETAVTAGLAVPPNSFDGLEAGGDGLEAFFWGDNLYNFNHHSFMANTGSPVMNTHIQCHNKTTGASCAGFPTYASATAGSAFGTGAADIAFPMNNQGGIDQETGRVLIPAAQGSTSGVLCVDLSNNTSCGYLSIQNTTVGGTNISNFSGGAMRGKKFYMIDLRNTLHCIDSTTMTPCGAPYPILIDPTQTTDGPVGGLGPTNSVELFGDYIFTHFDKGSGSHVIGCINAVTNAECATNFPATYSASGTGTIMLPTMDTAGNITGICGANANSFECFDLAAAPATNPYPAAPAGYPQLGHPQGFSSGLRIGTKVYVHYETTGATATYTCYDFAISAPCLNYTAPDSVTDVKPYTLRADPYNPGCIWMVGDAGTFQVFDASSGDLGCSRALANVSARPASFYCDGQSGHTTNWSNLSIHNITNAGYDQGFVTLADENGVTIPGWSKRPLTAAEEASGIIDISSLSTTAYPEIRAQIELLDADGSLWSTGDGNPLNDPYIQLSWQGDDMQFCFRTTVNPCIIGATGITNTASFTTNDGVTATDTTSPVTFNFPGSGCTRPRMEKAFSVPTVASGGMATLTMTITNTSGLHTAGTWSLTDNLPTDLVVANPANPTTTCTNGVVNATPGATSVAVSGDFVTTTAQCTVSFTVTKPTAGQVQNCAANIDPAVDIDKPTQCATITFTSAPTITTQINADGYSDDVTLGNTGGASGTLTWTLYGPVSPGPSGTCSDSVWSSAPVFDTDTMAVTGDVTVTTTPSPQPTGVGCYSYADTLTGPNFSTPGNSPVGLPSETFPVKATPSITTQINADGYSDNITVNNSGNFAGTITWTLFGPVSAGASGTCTDANWTGAPSFATGTRAVTANGTFTVTPSTQPTGGGCYSYAVTLSGPNYTADATSAVGLPSETFTVGANPTISTTINADGFSDNIVVGGTNGNSGTLTWRLYGPRDAGASGTCSDVNWAGAPVHANGTQNIVGDGTTTVTPSPQPIAPGCYSYEVALTGPNLGNGATSPVGLADETFVIRATPTITTSIKPDGYSDNVAIAGTHNFSGTVNWTLFGPVNSGASGTCSDSNWAGAASFATGTFNVQADNNYNITPGTQPTAPGCYSYAMTLSGTNYTGPVNSAVGIPSETFAISANPSITTQINADGYSDNITITNTAGGSGTLTWRLYGPRDAGASGTCSDVNWAGAPSFATGTLPVVGDGTHTVTPSTQPNSPGCYSYEVSLAGPNLGSGATSPVGLPNETFAVRTLPTLATQIRPDGYSDTITVGNTHNFAGTINWTLLGPVNSGASGTCSDSNWAGAPSFATGTLAVQGDSNYIVTPTTQPSAGGCYSYTMTLNGTDYTAPVNSAAGIPSETFAVASTPTLSTVINADGYSDNIIVGNTSGNSGTITWRLFGPRNAGASGTCNDVNWTGAPVYANGTQNVTGDGTTTVTPPTRPVVPGCYSYEVALTGPNLGSGVNSPVGVPSETFAVASTPAISTVINADGYSDNIAVTATNNFGGTLTWTLYGPVNNGPSGTCSDVNWAGAPSFATNSQAVVGDNTYTVTPPTRPTAGGCYSYAASLSGPNYTATATSAVGLPNETFSVKTTPTVSTLINADGYSDDIAVGSTANAAATIEWELLGPIDAGNSGTCNDANWASAPSYQTGTRNVIGDGTYTVTPTTRPTAAGCYSYEVDLTGANFSQPAHSARGIPSETFIIKPLPTMSTMVAQNGYSDNITIGNTKEFHGQVDWTLLGPIDAGPSGTCADAVWTGAPVVATGDESVTGDGVISVTPPSNPTTGGCYTYITALTGLNFSQVVVLPAGHPDETFARKSSPSIKTTASIEIAGEPPVATISDSIEVEDSNNFAGTLTWELVGPVAPVDGSCQEVDFAGAEIADEGEVEVIGDDTYLTEETTDIVKVGCYGYNTSFEGANINTATSSTDDPDEVVEMPRVTPTAATVASRKVTPLKVSSTDTVKITGSKKLEGVIAWKLHGPIKRVNGACPAESDSAWNSAPVKAQGNLAFVGDGEYTTEETEVKTGGCYTYTAEVTGDSLTTVATKPGVKEETYFVPSPQAYPLKTSDKPKAKPGETVTFTITITNPDPNFPAVDEVLQDDLSQVLDDAVFNNDIRPSAGTATYSAPKITWKGTVPAGQQVTLVYSVKVNDPPTGDLTLRNKVQMPVKEQDPEGPRNPELDKCRVPMQIAFTGGDPLTWMFDSLLNPQSASAQTPAAPGCTAVVQVDTTKPPLPKTGMPGAPIILIAGALSTAGIAAAIWAIRRQKKANYMSFK